MAAVDGLRRHGSDDLADFSGHTMSHLQRLHRALDYAIQSKARRMLEHRGFIRGLLKHHRQAAARIASGSPLGYRSHEASGHRYAAAALWLHRTGSVVSPQRNARKAVRVLGSGNVHPVLLHLAGIL